MSIHKSHQPRTCPRAGSTIRGTQVEQELEFVHLSCNNPWTQALAACHLVSIISLAATLSLSRPYAYTSVLCTLSHDSSEKYQENFNVPSAQVEAALSCHYSLHIAANAGRWERVP
jgi:hypothetical protein